MISTKEWLKHDNITTTKRWQQKLLAVCTGLQESQENQKSAFDDPHVITTGDFSLEKQKGGVTRTPLISIASSSSKKTTVHFEYKQLVMDVEAGLEPTTCSMVPFQHFTLNLIRSSLNCQLLCKHIEKLQSLHLLPQTTTGHPTLNLVEVM